MAKEFIIAIELGSSKMTGIAGKKNLDGSITVLSVAREDSTSCIRKGVVYNIDRTTAALTNLVKKLKNSLKTEIAQVYVGVGGQSLRSIRNTILKELPDNTIITQNMVDSIMDGNRAMSYPEQEILEAAIQEYKVDAQLQIDPVGIQCRRLEGNFLNILLRSQFYRNLKKCLENAGIHVAEMYLAPLVLADNVLTDAERRTGCVLVDLGADTTTVSVYCRNILRHLAVIPLGADNITKDIESIQIDEKTAEQLKQKFNTAFCEQTPEEVTKIRIDNDRTIDSDKLAEIIEARAEEIIENVWYQVPAEYKDKLIGGFVLTGGGSNLCNIEQAFRRFTHVDKVRIAKFVNMNVNAPLPDILPHDGTMNTVISLLAKGDENCAGGDVNNDLFANETIQTTGRTVPGIVSNEEQKRKAEEEARLKKEEEERIAQEKKEEEERIAREKEEEERKKNSTANKVWGWMKRFGHTIIEGDNENMA